VTASNDLCTIGPPAGLRPSTQADHLRNGRHRRHRGTEEVRKPSRRLVRCCTKRTLLLGVLRGIMNLAFSLRCQQWSRNHPSPLCFCVSVVNPASLLADDRHVERPLNSGLTGATQADRAAPTPRNAASRSAAGARARPPPSRATRRTSISPNSTWRCSSATRCADSPPWCWHWELQRCRAVLQALGEPEPQLPPFDPAKVKPLDYQADIRHLLAEHAQKQR
jgi:hypothetical protein